MPGAIDDARKLIDDMPETRTRLAKVTDLVSGFESPFGLELLATVHWVAKHEASQSLDDIVQKTYAWNDRKKRFTQRQIRLAVQVLEGYGWIEPVSAKH